MAKYLKDVREVVTVPITINGVGRYYFNLLVRNVNYQSAGIRREEGIGIINTHTKNLSLDASILLVDDSSMIRKALKCILNKLGYYNIIEADDGSTAIEMVKTHSPDFMFMDVVMDKVNGNLALQEIRKSGFDIPVVMLSSVTDQALIEECNGYGISGLIFKPIQANNGTEIIKDYLKIA
jgi:CheY-like chemotaxis protein